MPPRGRPKKKAEVVKKLEANDAAEDVGIKGKKIAKVEKALKKDLVEEVQSNNVGTELNGSGEMEDKAEIASRSNDKVVSKRHQKSAKSKGKIELSGDKEKEDSSKLEEDKSKDLPAKRGRRGAKIENGIDSSKAMENNVDTKIDVEVKELPRSRKNLKTEVESSNSIKEQNEHQLEETKARSSRKTKVQTKESSLEKEVPTKGAGRKRKNAIEKPQPGNVKDKKPVEFDENRQLRVALKRNQSLDEMARQQKEHDAEQFEEPKVKNAKGPNKGKGKRAAKDTTEDSQLTKKPKEEAKSKGAVKKEKIPDVTALDFSNKSKKSDGKPWNLKIANWNVNGLRAWLEKNGLSYLHHEMPDILCLQETKCSDDKLPPEVVNIDGYHCYWLAADKDGYSGIGLLSKEKPKSVQYGIGIKEHDNEGRVITAEYDEFYLVTTYIPNAGRGLVRLDYRQKWDKDFRAYIKKLDEKKPVVLCGDLNVAHEEIDLSNPKNNKKNAGFTKEEREGFSTLLSEGFVDTFRHFYPDKTGAYTFWTYMSNARAKNVGWRLDYFVISKRFVEHLCDSVIRKDVYGSDHCPIVLFLHV